MNRSRSVLIAAAATLVVLVGYQNCSKGFKSAYDSGTGDFSSGAGPIVHTYSIAQPASQVTNLGTQLKIPISISADPAFSGTVNLIVAEPELALLDSGAAIKFSFSPASVTLSGGTPAVSTLTVDVSTLSPSFALSAFHVQAVDSSNNVLAEVQVPLQVKAIYDAYMDGPVNAGVPSPENWSVAIGSNTKFISHPEGLVFNVSNMDPGAAHEVHSSGGPIPHAPGTLPASPDNGVTAGGVYSNTVPASATVGTSQLYCHVHEGGAQSRTFQFNVPVVPVVTASFASISNNILKPSCVTCHSPGNLGGGVDLSSYAGVMAVVVKNSSATSPLYVAVAPGGTMPKGGTPLSAAYVKAIADWINAGAKNN